MDEIFNQGNNKISLVNLQIYFLELPLSHSQNNFLEITQAKF